MNTTANTAMKTTLIGLLLLIAAPHALAQTPVSVYVFTKTDASGFVDADQKTRQKVAADVAKHLRKRKPFVVVDRAADARATYEITDIVTSEPVNNAFWIGLAGIGNRIPKRRAILTIGTYQSGFAAREMYAASGLAQLLIDWVKMNRARLDAE